MLSSVGRLLQKVLEMDYEAIDDWAAHKAEIEDYVTRHLASVVPGIEDQIVVQTSASARTSWRFTLNEVGSMLGWEMSPDQLDALARAGGGLPGGLPTGLPGGAGGLPGLPGLPGSPAVKPPGLPGLPKKK